MKTYLKYYVLFSIALFSACEKEETPLRSLPTDNSYARYDNPSNPVDHAIYEVYQQSNIPILYTDTISKNPLEILNLNYQLSGANTAYIYTYPKQQADILAGVTFVRDQILPVVGKNVKVYSISLMDVLKTEIVYNPSYSVVTNYAVVNGLTTVAIANVPAIRTMNASQLKAYRAGVLAGVLVNSLATSDLLTQFYAVSNNNYGKWVYGTEDTNTSLMYKTKEEYGFFTNGTEYPTSYQIGTQIQDLTEYLNKIFSLNAQEFNAAYASYPLIMLKYNYIKGALNKLGVDLTKI